EDLRGFNRFLVVRKQIFCVTHDLDLDKIAAPQFSRQSGYADGFFGVSGSAGVWKQSYALGYVVEDVFLLPGVRPANGQSYYLSSGVSDGGFYEFERIFSRTENKPRVKAAAS